MSESEAARTGAVIANHRRRRRWTLANTAAASGLSEAHISRIERGQRAPTLGVLFQLARAYGVSLGELVGEGSVGTDSGHWHSTGEDSEAAYLPVFTGRPDTVVQVVLVTVGAETSTAPSRHDGEERIHVLSGSVSVDVGDTSRTVRTGEFVAFDAARRHVLRGGPGGGAVLVISSTPAVTTGVQPD